MASPISNPLNRCTWQEDEVGYYKSSCDGFFIFPSLKSDDGPVTICPSCRGEMNVVPYQEDGSWE